MAGDWIKWGKGLASRREVVVLAARMKCNRFEIAGRLMQLWEWCDENIPDSGINVDTLNASLFLGDSACAFLDSILGMDGFAAALSAPEVGWLTIEPSGWVVFPNFGAHNGTTAKTRASEARKKQRQRRNSEGVPKVSRCERDKIRTITGTRDREETENINPTPTSPQKECGVGGVLTNLTAEDLQSREKLSAIRVSDPRWESERGGLLLLAAARRALDKGRKSPGGLFRRLLSMPDEQLAELVEPYIHEARQQLVAWRQRGASPIAAELAATLTARGNTS